MAFNDRGLVPCIVQDQESGEVLMMAWANAEAVRLTLTTAQAHFFSRSRHQAYREPVQLFRATKRCLCTFIDSSAYVPQDRSVRCPSLDAASPSAGAKWSRVAQLHMAEFPSRSVCAAVELTVDNDPRSDPGAYGNGNEGVDPGATPEPLFCGSQGVGVVLEDDRVAQPFRNWARQGDVVPVECGRGAAHPAGRVDWSVDTYSHSNYAGGVHSRRAKGLFDGFANGVDDGARVAGQSWAATRLVLGSSWSQEGGYLGVGDRGAQISDDEGYGVPHQFQADDKVGLLIESDQVGRSPSA